MESPKNLLVMSDLHLNEGWIAELGDYSPREDFYFDDDLFALLRHHHALCAEPRYGGHPWLIIFNGDTFDFDQVVALPQEGEELLRVCGVATHAELGKRARFGLSTSPSESRWKMQCIARGHPHFFAALGWFIAHGHQVLFIKGNHDVELHWPEVRAEARCCVLRAYRAYQQQHPDAPPLSAADVRANLRFEPWFYYDAYLRVYVEHGGQYEPTNHFANYLDPVLPQPPPRIDMPDGMALTRYVLNRLETEYPYVDNVRPITRAFAWMFADNPLRATRAFLGRARDLAIGWTYMLRKRRHATNGAEAAGPSVPRERHNIPAPLVGDIKDAARTRAQFSLREWSGVLIDQGLLGGLTLLGLASAGMGLVKLTRRDTSRQAARYFLVAMGLLNVGHLWSEVVNDDLRLDYMPNVAADLAERFRAYPFPLRAILLGHSHIARRVWLATEQMWMVNTGTWIPMLVQRPQDWERHLTFARLASGSVADVETPPEILEWHPETDTVLPLDDTRLA